MPVLSRVVRHEKALRYMYCKRMVRQGKRRIDIQDSQMTTGYLIFLCDKKNSLKNLQKKLDLSA